MTTAATIAVWVGVLFIGGCGSVARFMVDRAVTRRCTSAYPVGTWVVNSSGTLLLGVVTGLTLNAPIALLIGAGFLGAYTTFSTWMLETVQLAEKRRIKLASAHVVISGALGIGAVCTGQWIAHLL